MSSRITGQNTISIYRNISGPDVDGGPQYAYASTPTYANVPASVQYFDTVEDEAGSEGLERVSQINRYKILLNFNPNVSPRDQIIWVENGVTHTMVVVANPPSEAGRGNPFMIRAHEFI
jgi:hypothetical protein